MIYSSFSLLSIINLLAKEKYRSLIVFERVKFARYSLLHNLPLVLLKTENGENGGGIIYPIGYNRWINR